MSFLDRLGKTVSGFWGAVEEPTYGLVQDIAGDTQGQSDYSLGSFFHAIVNDATQRGADTLQNVFGPEGAIGAPVGGLPDFARVPGRYTVRPVMDADQWAYSHGISHPLATALYVGSLAESSIWTGQHGHSPGDPGVLFDPQAWYDSWEMTNHKSPGQALAENIHFGLLPSFGFDRGKVDIMNQGEVNKFDGSDFYKATSGLTDALAFRKILDPASLAGDFGAAYFEGVRGPIEEVGVAKAAEKTATKEALRGGATPEEATAAGAAASSAAGVASRQSTISQYLASPRWDALSSVLQRVRETIPDVNQRAAYIKNRVLRDPISYDAAGALAQSSGPAMDQTVIQAMMGDNRVIRQIAENDPALSERLRVKVEDQAMMHDPTYTPEWHQSNLYNPDANPAADADATMQALDANERLQRITGELRYEPQAQGALYHLSHPLQSQFFQASPYTRPLRIFTNTVPTGIINLGDPRYVDQVRYNLRQAGMSLEDQDKWVGKLANAPLQDQTLADGTTVPGRLTLVKQAEQAGLQLVADRHGIHPDDLKGISSGAEEYRQKAINAVQQATQMGNDYVKIQLPFDDQLEQVIMPRPTNPTDIYTMTNFPKVEDQFSKYHQFMDEHGRVPQTLINGSMSMWRAGVLLRPAWPVRIMGEHGLAMAAKMQDLAMGSSELMKGMKDYASWKNGLKNYWVHASDALNLGWGGGTGALFGGIVAGPLGALAGGALGTGAQVLGRSLDEVPYKQLEVNGYLAHEVFGHPLDTNDVHKNIVTYNNDLAAARGIDASKDTYRASIDNRPEPNDLTHTSIMPGNDAYNSEWERIVNQDIGKDPLARVMLAHDLNMGEPIYTPPGEQVGWRAGAGYRFPGESLEGKDGAEVGRLWLEHTPEGRAWAKQNPIRARDPEAWTETLSELTHNTLALHDDLGRKLIREGHLNIDDLQRAVSPTDKFAQQEVEAWVNQHVRSQSPGDPLRKSNSFLADQYNVPIHRVEEIRGLNKGDFEERINQLSGAGVSWSELTGVEQNELTLLDDIRIHRGEPSEYRTPENYANTALPLLDSDRSIGEVYNAAWDPARGQPRTLTKAQIPTDKIVTVQGSVSPNQVEGVINSYVTGSHEERVELVPTGDGNYVLIDGNHRMHAALARGDKTIAADIHQVPNPLSDRVRGEVQQTLDNYQRPTPLTPQAATPDFAKMPTLHGEYTQQVLGKSPTIKRTEGIIEQAYTALGKLPLDDLINNQLTARVYYAQMRRSLTGIEPGVLTDSYLRNIERTAKDQAVNVTRDLMYDFANRSEFANMVRTVMPFYPAWQQTIQRWAGLALENPAFINQARLALGAPNKMGLNWKDPDTGENYVRLRLPSIAQSIVNHGFFQSALDDQGYIRFQTKGLTLAGEGLPGFGPWVDVALSPFVKNHPELADSLKFIYPYGVPDNIVQSFMPPNVQRAIATSDENGRSFRAAYNRIVVTRLTKMHTGELPRLDLNNADVRSKFLTDAKEEAHQFMRLRLVAGMFSPAALQYDSPYQPFLEKYQAMLKKDPQNAQDHFLDQFGDDYFALTQAFTKLNNGIPATLQGSQDYAKYQNLVQRFPELGSLIVGDQGGGSPTQFSAAAYQKQLSTPIRPGSDIMQRSALSAEDIINQSDARLGWTKFTRTMDLLDAELAQSGSMNYNTKAAAPLRQLKDLVIAGIAQQHPQWFQEYSQRDEVKWNNRIAAMKVLAQDPRLSQRPDIAMLDKYLKTRDVIVAELGARPSHGIQASDNTDLRDLWSTVVQGMKQGPNGLAFSNLYNRWLDSDPLTQPGPTTIGEAAA
jgi:hypothetical protein